MRSDRRRVVLKPAFTGSTHVEVYRPGNKEPHFCVNGVEADDLDVDKLAEYMYGCDWTDKGSRGYSIPNLRCDEFMLNRGHK